MANAAILEEKTCRAVVKKERRSLARRSTPDVTSSVNLAVEQFSWRQTVNFNYVLGVLSGQTPSSQLCLARLKSRSQRIKCQRCYFPESIFGSPTLKFSLGGRFQHCTLSWGVKEVELILQTPTE